MQPLLCPGGYGLPQKEGKFQIFKILAACSSTVAASQIILADSKKTSIKDKLKTDRYVLNAKRIAACDANIEINFPEPIKVTDGIFPLTTSNLVPGSIFVYVR